MTRQYLIRDTVTGDLEWTAAATVREALIIRENELRASATKESDWVRAGQKPLPKTCQASYDSSGDMISVSLAHVSCIGMKQWVIRDAP